MHRNEDFIAFSQAWLGCLSMGIIASDRCLESFSTQRAMELPVVLPDRLRSDILRSGTLHDPHNAGKHQSKHDASTNSDGSDSCPCEA